MALLLQVATTIPLTNVLEATVLGAVVPREVEHEVGLVVANAALMPFIGGVRQSVSS